MVTAVGTALSLPGTRVIRTELYFRIDGIYPASTSDGIAFAFIKDADKATWREVPDNFVSRKLPRLNDVDVLLNYFVNPTTTALLSSGASDARALIAGFPNNLIPTHSATPQDLSR